VGWLSVAADDSRIDPQELMALIDRLEGLLQRSELSEIEVEAEGTALVLRTPSAVHPPAPAGAAPASASPEAAPASAASAEARPVNAVLAPLTGLFYTAPSPGAEPYVRVGAEVHVGQVIGLIEAMKLFNEIKSDLAGRVTRVCVDNGALVKAKQPLIEVAPQ
jgi:acetyl-CoA carboxylase biotin carboxyl carrier protein